MLDLSRRSALKILAAPAIIRLLSSSALAGTHGSLPCDIWALVGDSNAFSGLLANGSAGYDPAIDVTNNSCLQYVNPYQTPSGNSKKFTAICQDILGYNNSTSTFGAPAGSIGPGLTFIRDYWRVSQLATGRNVMIVACATGGTGLFNNGTSSFWYTDSGANIGQGWVNGTGNGAVARINAAVALNPGNKLVGMLWCSGANDANNSVTQANYQTAWGLLQTYVQANLTGGTNLPILTTGLCPTAYSTSQPVWLALANLTNLYHNVGYVDTSNATNFGGQNVTQYHFTAASQRNIGGLGGTGGFATAYQNRSA